MISVEEALRLVLQQRGSYGAEEVPLARSVNRILAEEVVADRDFPAYDRVTMDGIAIKFAAYDAGRRTFPVAKWLAAGDVPSSLDDPESCIEVMTGAVLPQGADTVVPYEQIVLAEGSAKIGTDDIRAGQHIHLRGTDSHKGAVLISKGTRIKGAHAGILASVGKSRVRVVKMPKVAVCSTGDELVAVDAVPASHQIRTSNGIMLAASLAEEGIEAAVFHFPDSKEELYEGLRALVGQYDVLLFSGAVSKGKFDLLPGVLELLNFRLAFHRIAQRPGKPMLFGSFDSGTRLFGFPGNPVSTFVCYHYYFRAWLYASLDVPFVKQSAGLAAPVTFTPKLSYHLLVTLRSKEGMTSASPVIGSGSGDLPGLVKCDGFVTLPAGRDGFQEGEVFDVILF